MLRRIEHGGERPVGVEIEPAVEVDDQARQIDLEIVAVPHGNRSEARVKELAVQDTVAVVVAKVNHAIAVHVGIGGDRCSVEH